MKVKEKIKFAKAIAKQTDIGFIGSYFMVNRLDNFMETEGVHALYVWKKTWWHWIDENWDMVADGLIHLIPKIIPTPLGDALETAILLFLLKIIRKLIPERNEKEDALAFCELELLQTLKT